MHAVDHRSTRHRSPGGDRIHVHGIVIARELRESDLVFGCEQAGGQHWN
jgi:hypothetical protein